MKNNAFKGIALLAVTLLVSVSAFAQPEQQLQTKRGPYLTNGFWDNWYMSVGAGVQGYFGEHHRDASTYITPAFDFSLGKWVTPTWGARFQISGLKAKSGTLDPNNPYVFEYFNNGVHNIKMNYIQYHIDVLFNLSSALGGYKEKRVYELIPFLGAGGISMVGNSPRSNEIAVDGGLINKFRLSKHFDFNIEMRATLFNQGFEDQWGGATSESIGSVTAGLTYKFGFKPFKRASELRTDLTPYNNRINDLEGELKAAKTRQAQLEKQLTDARNKKPTVIEKIDVTDTGGTAVFFPIGQSKITPEGKIILDQISSAIKASDSKFVITGYADKETGSKSRNMQLSQQRAKNVHDYLVSKGVNPDKLDIIAKGSEVNPFSQPYLNRVVIVQK